MKTVHILQIKILRLFDQYSFSLREHLLGKTDDNLEHHFEGVESKRKGLFQLGQGKD